MKLAELFGKGRTVFSCEVFPPKRDMPVDSIYTTLDGLKDIKPDFISVTFGAGGSKVNQTTREIASIIENKYRIPAMAHLTCVGAGREDVDRLMSAFPVTRLHYVASDGCALLLREAIDAMDDSFFRLYLDYHLATCEREDLAGVTSHALDIFRK